MNFRIVLLIAVLFGLPGMRLPVQAAQNRYAIDIGGEQLQNISHISAWDGGSLLATTTIDSLPLRSMTLIKLDSTSALQKQILMLLSFLQACIF